tara:strand:- start:188 stop:496 length:309 start_codon:yes stop_codon:yes gene_type:complete
MYNWLNANIIKKQISKSQKVGKRQKLVDILDDMNLKEDIANKMVIDKLGRLSRLIFDIDGLNDDATFVSNIMEDLIQSPHKRITKIEIERCNQLYRRYNSAG